ncbi:hypothetical protein GMO_07810 [Gluconobacter morbifer G707]|uniref:Uncharacterized protein n=1 Tax=Gluconobacter morbifer G707 TaxID=1088869 RepID=G6XH16_9PROT|nr:hypothetical protein GMO_07810 [Gluconobacter morbifer G707]
MRGNFTLCHQTDGTNNQISLHIRQLTIFSEKYLDTAF